MTRKKRHNFVLSDQAKTRLAELAKEDRRSMSQMLERLIMDKKP